MNCDFCNVKLDRLHLISPGRIEVGPTPVVMTRDWAACEKCNTFIKLGNKEMLLDHVMYEQRVIIAEVGVEKMRGILDQLYTTILAAI